MILTSNRSFAESGDVFGDPVFTSALLDRLLHHAIVIQIEGASFRLREHDDLIRGLEIDAINPLAAPKIRHGRSPKKRRFRSMIPADYRP